MKPFSERNPVVMAVIGIVVVIVAGLITFYSDSLPLLSGGTGYSADFADAAGLQSGDDVRVAGVKVGKVDSIALQGQHVHVDFTVDGAWIGDRSTVAIEIKSVLGQMYLAIDPEGSAAQPSDVAIPLARTTTPIDVQTALSGLADRFGTIDTARLAGSFEALSRAFSHTPRAVRAALDGLTSLSRTIASRDDELRSLAANAAAVTGQVAGSNRQIGALLRDGAALLDELRQRSAAITALLNGTRDFAQQLSGLVQDNQAVLRPALDRLNTVATVLVDNRTHLQDALRVLGPYYSMLTDATGSGRWLDVYICGLFGAHDSPVLDATARRSCAPPGTGGGR